MFSKLIAKGTAKFGAKVVNGVIFTAGAITGILVVEGVRVGWNYLTGKKPKGLRDGELERLVHEAANLKSEAEEKPAEEKKADEEKKEA